MVLTPSNWLGLASGYPRFEFSLLRVVRTAFFQLIRFSQENTPDFTIASGYAFRLSKGQLTRKRPTLFLVVCFYETIGYT